MIFFLLINYHLQLFTLVVKILWEINTGRRASTDNWIKVNWIGTLWLIWSRRSKIGLRNFIIPRWISVSLFDRKYQEIYLQQLFRFHDIPNLYKEPSSRELLSSSTMPKYLTSPRLRRFESPGDKPRASNHEDVLKRHSAQWQYEVRVVKAETRSSSRRRVKIQTGAKRTAREGGREWERKRENYAFAIWTTRGESETGGRTAMDEERRRARLGGS